MNNEINGKKAELRDRLRIALEAKKMRPIELSETTGIPKSMISYYLSGRALPKADRVYKMACVLDVNEAWLMGYDVPKERSLEQKKNDDLAEIIVKMRKNPELIDFVSMALKLSPAEFASFKQILSGLVDK